VSAPGDAIDLVASTSEPSFAVDDSASIIAWNSAAERLLGVDESKALGMPCHEVIEGKDVFGNRFCGENCALDAMARRREPARHFELDVRGPCGNELRVCVFAMVVRGSQPGRFTIVHLLHPTAPWFHDNHQNSNSRADQKRFNTGPANPGDPKLTRRETEVLRWLEQGAQTDDIARSLGISIKTVRNHIQNVFGKLDAHNRLEAICAARRHSLI
jgi:DNA-binding CsgD family transcriptional regulator